MDNRYLFLAGGLLFVGIGVFFVVRYVKNPAVPVLEKTT